jgi:clan AA aspartic protease (TIGR02281 family)
MQSQISEALRQFLLGAGFIAAQMDRNAVGHSELDSCVNGETLRLLVDTGASRTVIDKSAAQRLRLTLAESDAVAGGVGTADHAIQYAEIESLEIGGLMLGARRVPILDLEHVSRSLMAHGGRGIDGALGADILMELHAVIDAGSHVLYLHGAGRTAASE